MAVGTITKIMENISHILIEVNVGGSLYVATIDKPTFDALPTALDKQNLVINVLSNARKSGRSYENTFNTFVGTVVNIPD